MHLDEFVKNHTILHVESKLLDNYCTELIVDDPARLIELLTGSEYYISEILWWERAGIDTGSQFGMGGPLDPRKPDEFFFSEVTHFGKLFSSLSTKDEYLTYIRQVKAEYPDCDLYPSFDIIRK